MTPGTEVLDAGIEAERQARDLVEAAYQAQADLVYRHDWFAAVLLFGYRGRHHSFEWPR